MASGRFASHFAMIIASEMDKRESDYVSDRVIDLSECIIGGRRTHEYLPEIRLIGSLIYYGCSIMTFGATPGQQFCNISMIVPHTPNPTEVSPNASFTTRGKEIIAWLWHSAVSALKREVPRPFSSYSSSTSHNTTTFTRPPSRTLMLISLLLALGPYCRARVAVGIKAIQEMGLILAAPEDTHTPSTLSTPSTPSASSSISISHSLYKALLQTAVNMTSHMSRPNQWSSIVETIFEYMSEIHFIFFLVSSDGFLTWSQRVAGVKLMAKVPPSASTSSSLSPHSSSTPTYSPSMLSQSTISISAISIARAAIVAAYVCRMFYREFSSERERATIGGMGGTTGVGDRLNDEVEARKTVPSTSVHSSAGTGTHCPLCMDPVSNPACTPCGHIYCWSCLHGLCRAKSSPSSVTALTGMGGTGIGGTGMSNENIPPSQGSTLGFSFSALDSIRPGFQFGSNASKYAQSVKCPVCRCKFAAREIRALYGFC